MDLWTRTDANLGLRLFLDLDQVHGIPLVEQEGSQHGAHLAVAPVFAKDIRRVHISSNVVKRDHLGGDCFSRVVVCESVMSLG